MELTEIVNKLIGPIKPLGDSSQDPKRLLNLVKQIELVDDLIDQILQVDGFKGAKEHSVKKAAREASNYISELKEKIEQ